MGTLSLDTPVQYVKGVGPVRAEQLAELGIHTVEDLLLYFPRRFDLRRQAQPIETLGGAAESATVAGEVVEVDERRYGPRPSFLCSLDDGTACVLARWFHGGYLRDRIKPGMQIALSGKLSDYRGTRQFINPRWQIIWEPAGTNLEKDELLPVYPAGARLSSGVIAAIVKRVLPQVSALVAGWLPLRRCTARRTASSGRRRGGGWRTTSAF